MIISIVTDNLNSWIVPYAERLVKELESFGHEVVFLDKHEEVVTGDCAFFLGCEKLVKKDILLKNKYNLVAHESFLPQGKGWSPLTWQILEGKNEIPVTLFEAEERVDSGDIYFQEVIKFVGSELIDELREQQGNKTIELAIKFVQAFPNIVGKKQTGEETFYPKRSPKDSELDINKTIAEQFNLLRVVDNKRYPAFFKYRGHKYILKIEKENLE